MALVLFNALMHLAQAVTFSPVGKVVDCKLGYCFLLAVGLNLVALKRTRDQVIIPCFPHNAQIFDMDILLTKQLYAIYRKLARLGACANIQANKFLISNS